MRSARRAIYIAQYLYTALARRFERPYGHLGLSGGRRLIMNPYANLSPVLLAPDTGPLSPKHGSELPKPLRGGSLCGA